MALLASLLEGYATPALLAERQAFFRDDAPNRAWSTRLRVLLAGARREDRNRFEACLPLFQLRERKDRLAMATMLNRVDLNRPSDLRRLNRLDPGGRGPGDQHRDAQGAGDPRLRPCRARALPRGDRGRHPVPAAVAHGHRAVAASTSATRSATPGR